MEDSNQQLEIEIKLPVHDAAETRAKLRSLGFDEQKRVFEVNLVFDTPEGLLRRKGELLRLRLAAHHANLTFKGPAAIGRYKVREEIETEVADGAALHTIFERLGFQVVFRYEKYRTCFSKSGEPGHIYLDETPIGCFLELEGPADWIDRVAASLGYTPQHYITRNYGELFEEYKDKHQLETNWMVFG